MNRIVKVTYTDGRKYEFGPNEIEAQTTPGCIDRAVSILDSMNEAGFATLEVWHGANRLERQNERPVVGSQRMPLAYLAKQRGLKYGTLYKAVWDSAQPDGPNRLPAEKMGGTWMSSPAAVEWAIEQGKVRKQSKVAEQVPANPQERERNYIMNAYEVSGPNGTYIDLEDGRFADTVSGDTSEDVDAHDAAKVLRSEATHFVTEPTCGDWTADQMERYVGNER